MKIYCSRKRYSDKDAFLESLIGRDAWVKVMQETGWIIKVKTSVWLKILSYEDKTVMDYPLRVYKCNQVFGIVRDMSANYLQSRYKDAISDTDTVYSTDITLAQPVEVLTSAELFKLGDN